MTIHISGALVTQHGAAANNRGENEGNLTTLQKLLWRDEVHTTVSAEAIRWAIRYQWQMKDLAVRRKWNDETEDYDERNNFDAEAFIDDDLMGFMLAEGAKLEGNDAENKKKGKKDAKGTIVKRRGVLEVCRAVSLEPFAGDITFNARAGEKGSTSLYGTEVHATRYQYGFAMTPSRMKNPKRMAPALDAILSLGEVAGNHSRFLYDFSPACAVIRISEDPSPRILYCFDAAPNGGISAKALVRTVKSGDVQPEELFIGGLIADTDDGRSLQDLGVQVVSGVLKAGQAAKAHLEGRS